MSRFTGELLAEAERIVSLYPERRSALVPLCHLAQSQDGWLAPDAMEQVAELVGVTPAEVLGTASFYDMLHTRPIGRYLIGICTNIACLLQGAEELLEHASSRLGVHPGGTGADGRFTLEELECVAACDRAPCATVNWRFFGPLDPESFDDLVEQLGSGRLDDEVPPHGVLSRVSRPRGLEVPPEEIVAQRKEQDRLVEERKRAAQAAESSGGAEGRRS